MKKFFLIPVAVITLMAACNQKPKTSGEAGEVAEVKQEASTYKMDPATSSIEWVGKKLAYSHNGTLALSSGSFAVDSGKIKAGSFTIDMKSLKDLDVTDEKENAKLVGHLLSPDFFAADSFPTANFEIVSVMEAPENPDYTHQIEGNLTLRGITRKIFIPANITMDPANGTITAKGDVEINRTEWNVMWGAASLVDWTKDKIVSDMIQVKVNLTAKADQPAV